MKMIYTKLISLLCAGAMLVASATGCASGEAPTAELTTAEVQTVEYKYKLSNPNADETTKKIYNYVCEEFGTHMISCQQESTWMTSPEYEMEYLFETTGKYPAMRGLDFMNADFNGCVKRSKEWADKGGLVTICWHTGVGGKGYNESKADDPDFSELLTEGTDEYNKMIANWDKAADALSQLQDDGITVFWRPFHEFDGKWFWWGKGEKDNFIALWRMMYNYFTNEKGLNNLIWVLGYADFVKDGWYPGDEYCDIIGSDTYKDGTNSIGWKKLAALETGKPLAFHECGNVPKISDFEENGNIWSWFMIWHTEWLTKNDKDNLKEVYNSDLVLTLDELPELYNRSGTNE